MGDSLIGVDMNAVAGDKYAGRGVVAFGVDVLAERTGLRERGSAGLDTVLGSLGQRQIGALHLAAVLAGPGECLREINCEWTRRRGWSLAERGYSSHNPGKCE